MQYRVLGPVELEDSTGCRSPASSSQRALLAALLLEAGRPVATDRLADAMWGDRLPTDAAGALRTQVMRLRRSLGDAAGDVLTVTGGYRLVCADQDLDAVRFAGLLKRAAGLDPHSALVLVDEALALWRGPAYADVLDLPAVRPEAARLDELRVVARQRRAELLLAVGAADEAAADLARLLAEEPEREEVRALLMRARYACGQHTEALALFDEWRTTLRQERGLDPSPALRALHRDVLRHALDLPAPVPAPAPAVEAHGHAAATRLLGREQDLEALGGLLDATRLVTLTGPGGVGKTRLALELAQRARGVRRNGAPFCDLSVVERPVDVARAVAAAVGVEERAGVALEEHLIEQLRGQDLLLVLDNCEHVVEPVAQLAEQLIDRAAGVRLLATSRERLCVAGEQVWEVPPLSCAHESDAAVELFVDRAGAVDADRHEVLALCRHLDGLPLAIELAAAQAPRWGVGGLLAALDRRLDVLGAGRRTSPRHRSLRALVDWSYDQLSEEQQVLFQQLCVFAGSFDLAAAEAVAGAQAGTSVAAGVMTLLERSMVSTSHDADGRLTVLENLRAYGLDRLRSRGAEDSVRASHAHWALQVATGCSQRMWGPGESLADQQLRGVFDELRAAHAWLVEHDPAAALQLTQALHGWALFRNASEVFRWAESAARAAGERPEAAGAWASAAVGACQRGDLVGAQAAAAVASALDPSHPATDEAEAEIALTSGDLAVAGQRFDRAHEARLAAGELGQAVWDLGSASLAIAYGSDQERALEVASSALLLAERAGGPTARAFAQFVLGEVHARSDVAAAERHLGRAVELASASQARMVVGLARVTLATLAARHRDLDAALVAYEQVVEDWMSTGTWTAEWVTLRTLVDLLERAGAHADAALLHGATCGPASGVPPFGEDARLLAEVELRLRATLGDATFEHWSRQGASCGPEDAAALALASIGRARALTCR